MIAADDSTTRAARKPRQMTTMVWGLGIGAFVVVAIVVAVLVTPEVVAHGCKTRQAEVKTGLSQLFKAEKAFFGRYGFFTTDMASLGWEPDGTPQYVYGFAVAGEVPEDAKAPEGHDPTRMAIGAGGAGAVAAVVPVASARENRFLAVGVGNIDRDDQLDVWTIDEQRVFTIVDNDCSKR